MTNLLRKKTSKPKSCRANMALSGFARASFWKITTGATLLVSIFWMAGLVGAQKTEVARQSSMVQEMSTLENLPAPQLEFVGREDYEVNAAKGIRYKLSVTNRASHPDFLWRPSSNLPACGKNQNAARTWVEVFGSPGGKRLAGFCGLRTSEDLGHLWFPEPSGEKAPACVYIVMTDRQTGKKYMSNRVCSRSFAVATDRLKADGTQNSAWEGREGWIDIASYSLGVHQSGESLPDKLKAGGKQEAAKERRAGMSEVLAEREKNKSESGNQAVTGRITSVAIDPGDSSQRTNKKANLGQPDLMIKQFLFPPTNDKALRVHVVNQGNAASGACRLILTVRKINGTAVGRQTHVNIPALGPSKKVWLVIDAKSILPNNVSLQSTTFKLNADATGIVAESDETNNEVWHNL